MAARLEEENPLSVAELQDLLVRRFSERKPFPEILQSIKRIYGINYSDIGKMLDLTKASMTKWIKGFGISYEHLISLYYAFPCLSMDELTLSVYPDLWLCQQAEAMRLSRKDLKTVLVRLEKKVPDEVVYKTSVISRKSNYN